MSQCCATMNSIRLCLAGHACLPQELHSLSSEPMGTTVFSTHAENYAPRKAQRGVPSWTESGNLSMSCLYPFRPPSPPHHTFLECPPGGLGHPSLASIRIDPFSSSGLLYSHFHMNCCFCCPQCSIQSFGVSCLLTQKENSMARHSCSYLTGRQTGCRRGLQLRCSSSML